MMGTDHFNLEFDEHVRHHFNFLSDAGFFEIEALPTLVRYKKGEIEVSIYHGRNSHEVGAGISISGTQYSISEIVKASDPRAFEKFRYVSTTTREGVDVALKELSTLLKSHAGPALEGDQNFTFVLSKQRDTWSKEFELDVLARQLRPKATEAFRRKDYATAAALYFRIKERLSQAETKKLKLAQKLSSKNE